MKNEIFTNVYNKYYRLVIKTVIDSTNDVSLAQEICQQTLMAYYKNMDTIPNGFTKAWIMLTTKNLIIDHLRKASVRKEFVSPIIHMAAVPEYTIDNVVDKVFYSELATRIFQDLKAANEKWYFVVVAVCIDGLPHDIAAERLGISITVLRARLYRARLYIRAHYLEEFLETTDY